MRKRGFSTFVLQPLPKVHRPLPKVQAPIANDVLRRKRPPERKRSASVGIGRHRAASLGIGRHRSNFRPGGVR